MGNDREFLIRTHAASDIQYGSYPGARSIENLIKYGIVVLDKPRGPTCKSIDVIIKKIFEHFGFKVIKCSHGGTLDPGVSGTLVIMLNKSTKLTETLLKSKKEYVALIYLHSDVSEEKIRQVCNEFVGKIKQLPPLHSAVARQEREREIYYIEILEINGRNVLMRVGCEAGTYIRRLADDIGKKLGTGAHLQELRRTKSGRFTENDTTTLHKLWDALALYREEGEESALRSIIKPVELLVDNMKCVVVLDTAIGALCNGAPLAVGGISRVQVGIKKGDNVAVLTLKGELICIGKALIDSESMVNNKRGLCVKNDAVVMEKGIYLEWKKEL